MPNKINHKPSDIGGDVQADAVASKSANLIALNRLSKALANAKQRCTNPKNPDFPSYGGAGIKMLIEGRDQLVATIGLPKPGHSLDRINPNGHYELGNVRWVTPAVQAANKKQSLGTLHYSLTAQIVSAKEAFIRHEDRKNTAIGWVRVLRAYNEGHLPKVHALWLAENLMCPGVMQSSFDVNSIADWGNHSPGYAHLPALSLPKARVRIRCQPAINPVLTSEAATGGRLLCLEEVSAEWNVPNIVWQRAQALVQTKASGIALIGMPSLENLLGGWIEGACLAMASCLASNAKVTSACYPMLRIFKMLDNLPGPDQWDEVACQMLDVRVLLIPDFCLDCGAWGERSYAPWWKVGALLRYRYENGLQTIVGVQQPAKLPAPVREIVLGAYELLPMPKSLPHEQADLTFLGETHGVPAHSTTLRELETEPALSRLVVHSGLVGT